MTVYRGIDIETRAKEVSALLSRRASGEDVSDNEVISSLIYVVHLAHADLLSGRDGLRRFDDDLLGAGMLALVKKVPAILSRPDLDNFHGYVFTAIRNSMYDEARKLLLQSSRVTLFSELESGGFQERHYGGTAEATGTPNLKGDGPSDRVATEKAMLEAAIAKDDTTQQQLESIDSILSGCKSQLERDIVLLRSRGHTVREIGEIVSGGRSSVSRVLKSVESRLIKLGVLQPRRKK